jgi:hypothetical protein
MTSVERTQVRLRWRADDHYFHRKCTKSRPKFFESFSTR